MHNLDIEGNRNRIHQHQTQTNIPIVKIDTGGKKVPGTPIIGGETRGYETSENEEKKIDVSLSVSGLEPLESLAQIRYRGNSSRHFDKKGYLVNLISADKTEKKKEVLGMTSHDEWILNGPFLDRSLLRNYVALNMAGELMEYAPNVRYCELYVDEAYQGIYLLVESVSRGEGRIDIEKPNKKGQITDYIVQLDRKGKGKQEINHYSYYTYRSDKSALDIRYPGKKNLTEKHKDYIERDISKLEKSLYSYDLLDKTKGASKYLDMNAFAEYFIINELWGNSDAGQFSTFYYKSARGVLKPCVWDFNNAADNYMDYELEAAGFTMIYRPMFDQLIKDKRFVDLVVKKYKDLRKDKISEEYILNYIDESNLWLGEAVDRNYEKWGYVFELKNYNSKNYLTPVERNYTSHEDSVDQLKDYLVRRGKWLDRNIEVLYQYCHDSKNINELMK